MLWKPHVFDAVKEMEVFDAARENATGDTSASLVGLRSSVKAAYVSYADSASASSLSPILAEEDEDGADALRSNYPKIRSGVKKEMGSEILSRSKKCCLCGHAPSAQLDHHLPKTTFPEFSVLTLNLIPVCADCNFKKKESYRRVDGGPAFLHAYRDRLPAAEPFLVADISIGDTVAADFRVVQTQSISNSCFETLQHHFEFLGLAERYGELSTELMGEKLTPIYEYFDEGGPELVAKYLLRDARGARRKYGVNHWKHALLDALANDGDFCEGGFASLGERDELPL